MSEEAVASAADAPSAIATTGISAGGWRVVAASVRGPAHTARDGMREDGFAIGVEPGCAIAVVCDGAGTASRAAWGANGFAGSVLQALAEAARQGIDALQAEFRATVIEGVEDFRRSIVEKGEDLHDYHATLLAIVTHAEATLVAHVGDGLAGIAPMAQWETSELSLPRNGEFANETFFVTEDDWTAFLRCEAFSGLEPGGVAVLLTDGAMPFVLAAGDSGLDAGFMAPVSRFLATGPIDKAAEALGGTLDSKDARRISSDDKTIVWIGRESV